MCNLFFFFFSSRRRHTRCALVTGVQTCALPIYEIPHYPVGYAGFPNTFVAPDAGHWTVGAAKTKATMVAGDKLSTDVIDRAVALAKKMQGGEGKAVRMTPVDVDGGKHFIGLFGTEQMYDIDRKSVR